jgi:hypothetical protein
MNGLELKRHGRTVKDFLHTKIDYGGNDVHQIQDRKSRNPGYSMSDVEHTGSRSRSHDQSALNNTLSALPPTHVVDVTEAYHRALHQMDATHQLIVFGASGLRII